MKWRLNMVEKNDDSTITQWLVFSALGAIIIYTLVYPAYIKAKNAFISFNGAMKFHISTFMNELALAHHSLQILIPIIIRNWKFYIVLFVFSLPFLIYYNYQLMYKLIKWKEDKKNREAELKAKEETILKEKREIKRLVYNTAIDLSYKELKELRKRLRLAEASELFSDLKDDISNKIGKIELALPVVRQKEEISHLDIKEELAKERVEQLDMQIKDKEIELRNFEDTSLRKLNADDNPVFIEELMTENEKNLLMKYDYKRAFEYCVCEQDYIHVLVKPTMKHSITHTFLVWSVKKFVSKMIDVTNVVDWDTRDPDITFKYKKKDFALEIETGTLLKKQRQLRAKIDYLNNRYKNRWMIIVSKKTLMPKYRRFGPVSARSELEKKLKKLLKSA